MSVVPANLLSGFVAEAREYLASLRQDLAKDSHSPSLLNSMAERLGVLAGGADMLSLGTIAQLADPAVQRLSTLASSDDGLSDFECRDYLMLLDQIEQQLSAACPTPAPSPLPLTPARAERYVPDLPAELLNVFLLEAREHCQSIQTQMELLRERSGDPTILSELRRVTHTLKGAAASVGFRQLANLAHLMEEVFERHLNNATPPVPEVVELLLDASDALDTLITPEAVLDVSIETVITRFEALLGEEFTPVTIPADFPGPSSEGGNGQVQPVGRPENLLRLPLASMDLLINRTGEIIINRSRLERQLGAMRDMINDLNLSIKRLRQVTQNINAHIEITLPVDAYDQNLDPTFDPLELDRYSLLYQFARELEEIAADTGDTGTQLGFLHDDLSAGLTYERRLTADLQDSLMATRLVSFYELETRIRRIVHRTARDLNKSVEVALSGFDTKVDKTILDTLADPLMHLLRNAVDHGIEPTDVREAVQKSIPGVIRLHVARERGRVVITLSDDGAGIDLRRVHQRGLELGLLTPGDRPGSQQLLSLLFEEGFSLARHVTQTSGRGVGLDIVRHVISRLQGTVRVDSTFGLGTTFVISVPVTLAITQALFVTTCNQRFCVPLDQVTSVVRLSSDALSEYSTQGVVRHNGQPLPAFDLTRFIQGATVAAPTARYGLAIETGEQLTIVLVDSLIGIREAVVKSLGTHLRRVPGIAGATIAGDGSVTLILDLLEIVVGEGAGAGVRKTLGELPPLMPPSMAENPHVLVVDDSSSVRRVVCSFLERIGWQATDAKDGIDALEKIAGTHPDVALVDIEMPRMNGYELLSRIKSDPVMQHIPVVFLTSRAAAKHRERAAQLHVDGYLVKPYREAELIEELLRVMGR